MAGGEVMYHYIMALNVMIHSILSLCREARCSKKNCSPADQDHKSGPVPLRLMEAGRQKQTQTLDVNIKQAGKNRHRH